MSDVNEFQAELNGTPKDSPKFPKPHLATEKVEHVCFHEQVRDAVNDSVQDFGNVIVFLGRERHTFPFDFRDFLDLFVLADDFTEFRNKEPVRAGHFTRVGVFIDLMIDFNATHEIFSPKTFSFALKLIS